MIADEPIRLGFPYNKLSRTLKTRKKGPSIHVLLEEQNGNLIYSVLVVDSFGNYWNGMITRDEKSTGRPSHERDSFLDNHEARRIRLLEFLVD